MRFFYLLFFVSIIIGSGATAQIAIELRLNRIGDHYANLFNSSLEQDYIRKAVNDHLFKYYGRRSEIFGQILYPDESYLQENSYTFYFLGIALKMEYEKNLSLRLRADRFYFVHNKYISISDKFNTKFTNLLYSTKLTSFQLTPGIFKEFSWKFLEFGAGLEIPFYFRSDEISSSTIVYTNDTTVYNKLLLGSYYMPGGFFTGVSAVVAINLKITDNIHVGIEYGAGAVYLFQASEQYIYLTPHYPSLSLSYNFGHSKKPMLFKKDTEESNP
mgnify:CR=1 FL=1